MKQSMNKVLQLITPTHISLNTLQVDNRHYQTFMKNISKSLAHYQKTNMLL